jgi:hypothetical protein
MSGGFAIIRGGILDHLLAGTISFFDLGIYVTIHLQADFATGVWLGSAPRLLAAAPRATDLRKVQRSLQNLVNAGFLRSFHVRGSRHNFPILINRYDVKLGALKGKRLIAAKSEDWRHPYYESCAEDVVEGGTEAGTEGGAEPAPSSEVRSQEAVITRKREASSAASQPPSRRFFELWNSNRGQLAEARTFSKGRAGKCVARSRELSDEQFREAVRLAASTPFCLGVNDRGWRVTFDWLIANDTNALKVLEGKYASNGNYSRHDHGKTDSAAESFRQRFN